MKNLFGNVRTLLSNAHVRSAYAKWLLAKTFTGQPPRFEVGNGALVGGWINFSEYVSYSTSSGIAENEKKFARECLARAGQSPVAFDLGANIGVFTCFLASLGQVRVHSFEPITETFCRLKTNVFDNRLAGKCSLNCLAVGGGYDLVTFSLFGNAPGLNRLSTESDPGGTSDSGCFQRVVTVALDDYCDKLGIDRIHFLKVDVEGMKPAVLAGANRLMSKKAIDAILMEVCPKNLRTVGFDPAILYKRIRDVGYRPFSLTSDGNIGKEMRFEILQETDSPNVVVVPE